MDEHPNVDLMRRGYAAFEAGDMATVGELFADDIVWHANAVGALSGDYVGKDAVMGFFGALVSRATLQQDLHDIVANDEHVVVLVRGHAKRSDGATLNDDNIHVWHVRDGRATEFWGFSTDPDAANAFFA